MAFEKVSYCMRKRLLVMLGCMLGVWALTSCIREEAQNAECDITGVDSLWLRELPEGMVTGNPVVKNNSVTFFVAEGTDVTALNPRFYVTPGARLLMKNALGQYTNFDPEFKRDFTTPKTYTVVSESGQWHKDYVVSFETPSPLDVCSFEHFQLDDRGQYQCLLQEQSDGSLNAHVWDCGNGGFALSGMAKTPEEYPTTFVDGGVTGKCARLETKSTGDFGRRTNMPLAAGNLFIGEFRVQQAMLLPLQATRFGLQIAKGEPESITGWYKYTPGETYKDRAQNVHPELRDSCDIYAVLFEVDPAKVVPLAGDNVMTSDRVVMLARLEHPGEPQEWTRFEAPFRLMEGKTFSRERLKQKGYAFTMVASSSRGGAFFQGAVGSVLFLDDYGVKWK